MKKILIIFFLLLFCLFLYGKYIDVYPIKIHEYTIKNSKIPKDFEELKIVHFSDILYDSKYDSKRLDKLISKINDLTPDIIIFTGDLFNSNTKYTEKDFTTLSNTLTKMNANLYKYAVIGDNDQKYIEKYKDILYTSNFILLDNQNKLLFYKNETPINIIGLSNTTNINDLLTSDIPYNYSLAIIHEPDNIEELNKIGIDTILAGHSLGGVINIPFYGGVIKKDGARTYINDYYKLSHSEIFISNGLGYEHFNFRLFNTPSINVYRFSK